MISLDTIFPKSVNELSEEEKSYLNAHANQLSLEQKTKFESVLTKEETGQSDNSSENDQNSSGENKPTTND